jgi:uncharacterized protein (DUF3820 family)
MSQDALGRQNKIPTNYSDDSLMPFGKFRGKSLKDVPADYLLWLYNEAKDLKVKNPDLHGYIYNAMKALKQETAMRSSD